MHKFIIYVCMYVKKAKEKHLRDYKSELKPIKFCLKIDFVSHPACTERW